MKMFANKIVLITGAAGGIGQELARGFGAAGGRIGLLDQSETVIKFSETLANKGIECVAAVADIASIEQVVAAFDLVRSKLGPVTILINNAGFSSARSLASTTAKSWSMDIGSNLNGPYHCTREALADMKKLGGGAIVSIGSVNGLSSFGDPAYSAAKAGLISYTKAVAMEYGRFGIRANVICPGTVRTPIWADRVEKNPQILDELIKWYPLRRVADPVDIANVAIFLASENARAITGAMLPVDCGLLSGNIAMSRELTLEEF